jgi:hypothetical protein
MPLIPATWATDSFITAKALNTALYEYQPGTYSTPTGIQFLAQRPVLVEGAFNMSNHQSSSSGTGTYTNMQNNNGWHNYYDSAAFFDYGMDQAGANGDGGWAARVAGSSGTATIVPGGYWLTIMSASWGSMTSTSDACGTSVLANGVTWDGGKQGASATQQNTSYAVEIMPLSTNSYDVTPYGWASDGTNANYSYNQNSTDYSGRCCRIYVMWLGINTNITTVGALPVPFTAYTSSTALTSSFLNGTTGVNGPLTFLACPPILRAATATGQTVTATTTTTVTLSSTPQADTYAGFNTSTHTYTVPVNGVYLVHGLASYNNSATGAVKVGVSINSGTLVLWGAAGGGSGSTAIAPSMTRLLDLHAGDTVQLVTYSTATQALSSTLISKLLIAWMGSLGVPSTLWASPSPSYRWQAGTPAASLPALWSQYVGNDLSFLMQKPYLMSYQSTQQTGLTTGAYHTITMDNVTGRVHGTAGDSYSGWTTGSSNLYTAKRAGWYLVIGGYLQNNSATGPYSCLAAINQSPAGSSSPDQFQNQPGGVGSSQPQGSDAVGLYYLRVGDTVQPQYQQIAGTSPFSTTNPSAAVGSECHFECIWVSN